MTLVQLLKECRSRNIVLGVEAGQLVVDAPEGAMDDMMRMALRNAKTELLQRLAGEGIDRQRVATDCLVDDPGGDQPLTPFQEPLWNSLTDGSPGNGMIVETFDVLFPMSLDELREALAWLCKRHRMLRMLFSPSNSGLVHQSPAPEVPVNILFENVKNQPGEDREKVASRREKLVQKMLVTLRDKPYEPASDAPLLAGYIRGKDDGTLLLRLPHLAADALSFEIIVSDLSAYFESRNSGKQLLEDQAPQYTRYVRWLASRDKEEERRGVLFWRKHLKDSPELHGLPTDYSRPQDPNSHAFAFRLLDLQLIDAVRKCIRECGVSDALFFQTALRISFYLFSGCTDLPLVMPVANRQAFSEADRIVGCFANQVALRVPLDPEASVKQALQRARSVVANTLDAQNVPFNKVVEAIHPSRSPDRLPVAQLFFSYLQFTADDLFSRRFQPASPAGYDISCVVADCRDGIKLMLGYNESLYAGSTMNDFAALFQAVCNAVPESLESPLSSLLASTGTGIIPESAPNLSFFDSCQRLAVFEDEMNSLWDYLQTEAQARSIPVGVVPREQNAPLPPNTTLATCALPSPGVLSLLSPGCRILLLNHLPCAPSLRDLAGLNLEGDILLELPHLAPKNVRMIARIPFSFLGGLSGRDLYIPCLPDPDLPCRSAGLAIDLTPALHIRQRSDGIFLVPLPNAPSGYIWVNGQGIDLDALALAWSRETGTAAVFGLRPSHDGTDRLTAWLAASNAANLPEKETLHALRPGLPSAWPEYRLPVPALPLTVEGNHDRAMLSRRLNLSSGLLQEAGKAIKTEHGLSVDLALSDLNRDAEVLHSFHLFPESPGLSVHDTYSTLGLERDTLGDATSDRPSLVSGAPLTKEISYDFLAHMRMVSRKDIVFVDIKGKVKCYTGEAFLELAQSLLAALQERGLKAGSRLLIYCAKEEEMLSLAWACLLGGICMTPLLAPLPGQSTEVLHTRLGHMHAILDQPVLVTTPDLALPIPNANLLYYEDLKQLGKQLPPPEVYETKPETPIFTAFTSGSTGPPKAVPLTARNMLSTIYGKTATLGHIPDEVVLSVTALDHVGSVLCHSFYATVRGSAQVYCSFQYVLGKPTRLLDLFHTYRVSNTWAPDFAWRLLYQAVKAESPKADRWDLSCLHHIISGGENTREATFANLREALSPFGLRSRMFITSWGMSETSSFMTLSGFWEDGCLESHNGIIEAGSPLPGITIRIADKQGGVLPEGCMGSFQARGPAIFGGYYKNAEANEESFTDDGWFITGDLAMVKNGKIIFCGRDKEQIIINGQNISQFDIEGFIDGLEGVEPSYTAVIGCRNNRTGDENVLVFAHTPFTTDVERAGVIRRINSSVGSHYGVMPRHVLLVEKRDIPKAALGKIQRTVLLKRFIKGEFNDRLAEMDLLLRNSMTVPDWFAAKGLVSSRLSDVGRAGTDFPHILVAGDKAYRTSQAAGLKAAGADVISFEVEIHELIPRWRADRGGNDAEAMPPVVVVLEIEPEDATSLEHLAWRERAFKPLLTLLAGLSEIAAGELCVVTRLGQSATDNEIQRLWTSSLPALLSAFSRACGYQARLIDLAPGDTLAEEVCAREILQGAEPVAIWRYGKRFVPCLRKLDWNASRPAPFWDDLFAADSYCLCTGMTGKLGRILLPQLLKLTVGNFLAVGRMDDEAGELFLDTMELNPHERQRVRYARADLSDPSELSLAMERAAGRFAGNSVAPGGILHLAADTRECDFTEIDPVMLCDVLAARQKHLESLEEAFRMAGGSGPRVTFSSVLGFSASPSSGLYSPACALAEAFVRNFTVGARRESGAWHCIGWSRWKGASDDNDFVVDMAKRRGFLTIDLRQGAMSLLAMLYHSAADADGQTILAGLDNNSPEISRFFRLPGQQGWSEPSIMASLPGDEEAASLRPLLSRMAGGTVRIRRARAEAASSGSTSRDSVAVPAADSSRRRMAAVWAEVLHVSHVDPFATFFDLGGTSVHIPRLRKAVQSEFGMDIGNVGVFNYPCVEDMAVAVSGAGLVKPRFAEALERAEKRRAARRSLGTG